MASQWSILGILTLILMVAESSVYSGRESICSLEECECQLDTVICTCTQDSSFQVNNIESVRQRITMGPTIYKLVSGASFLKNNWSSCFSLLFLLESQQKTW